MQRLGPLEILLLETALYLLLWVLNDYLATLFSLIFASIFLVTLVTALIIELVERSKVPRWYFSFMGMSVLAPLLAAVLFALFSGGLEWM